TEAPTVSAGGKVIGRVKFFVVGEGTCSIWGGFMIDEIPGPSFYQTINAPINSEYILFETELPTSYGGIHNVYFELLSPNHLKTRTATYTVTEPEPDKITIESPTDGQVVSPGQELTANATLKVTGFGSKAVDGYWVIDGVKEAFTETAYVAGEAYIKLQKDLPTNVPGNHTLKLIVNSPYSVVSDEISYRVEGDSSTLINIDPIIEGTTVSLNSYKTIKLTFNVTKAGLVNLFGYLMVDGEVYYTLNESVNGPIVYTKELAIPTTTLGNHSVYFKLLTPVVAASNIVTYRVVGTSWVWPYLIYPADGTTVKQGDPLIAQLGLHVGGIGTVKIVGQWFIDDNPYADVEQLLSASSSTIIFESLQLPTDSPGWHRLKFRQTWPQYEETREVWYRVWGREQPPSFIDVTAIPEPPYPQHETFQLRIKANDDRGIKTVVVQLNSQLRYTYDANGLQVIDYTTPAIGPVPAGEHWWRVVLTDIDGLETDYIGRFTVTSGEGSLIGSVIRKNVNTPIVGAVVTCSGRTAITDEYGKYTITGLGVGEQIVSASHPDYGTKEARVIIYSDYTTTAPALELTDKGPEPVIYLVESYPSVPVRGQAFILNVYVRNDGENATESEVVVSSPDGAVIVIDPDTEAQYPSFSHVYDIGAFMEHRDGQQIRAIHQSAVVRWNTWETGTTRKLMLKVTPTESKKYHFWIRSTMNIDNRDERVNTPFLSEILDQTGYPSKVYEVVVP
ncbi:MAG: carboxypeptidase-like regulatory domain-containing protein, partial [Caldisericia bacterium]